MEEKIRVLTQIEIPRFSDYVDLDFIRQKLNDYVKTIIGNINIQDLEDWKILVNVIVQRKDVISIAKRVARFPSDKEYVIYMSIPIPDNDKTHYGLSVVKEAFYKTTDKKYSHILEPKFNDFDKLEDYFIESTKSAIDFKFSNGFTCNGKKIKYQKVR